MINAGNIIGALMEGGLNSAGGARLQNALGPRGLGQDGMGDLLGNILGGGQGGDLGNMLSNALGGGKSGGLDDMLGGVLGGGRSEGLGSAALGGLLGGLFGGGGGMGGAAKGGAMAVLGMLAINALKGYLGDKAVDPAQLSNMQLLAGLREPETSRERQQVEDLGLLTVDAMINAAKADAEVDEQEMQKIIGRLQESDADESELDYLRKALSGPMDTNAIVSRVDDPQVAAQVYTASLFAISVDTDAERIYVNDLAHRLGLPQDVRDEIHAALGL
ncbi:MAG: tellurite resistance TerB family protein [Candidatus Sedimenticola sp. 20ELBAFRAG]